MGLNLYGRIVKRKYSALEAIIVLGIYMIILIAYTIFMVWSPLFFGQASKRI